MSSDEEPQPDAKAEYSDEAEDEAHRSSVLSQGKRESKKITGNEIINNVEEKNLPEQQGEQNQLKTHEQVHHALPQQHTDPVANDNEVVEQSHKKSTNQEHEPKHQHQHENRSEGKKEQSQKAQQDKHHHHENINQHKVKSDADHFEHDNKEHHHHEDKKEQHIHHQNTTDHGHDNPKQVLDQEKLEDKQHEGQPNVHQAHQIAHEDHQNTQKDLEGLLHEVHQIVDQAVAKNQQIQVTHDHGHPSNDIHQQNELIQKVSDALLIPSAQKYSHLNTDQQDHKQAEEKKHENSNGNGEHLQTHETLDESKRTEHDTEKVQTPVEAQVEHKSSVEAEKQEEAASQLKLMRETAPLVEHENIGKEEESVISRRVLAPSIKQKPPKEQELGKNSSVCECSMM